MNDKIGFDIAQIMMKAETVQELDEAMRIVNNIYPKFRERLEVIETVRVEQFE